MRRRLHHPNVVTAYAVVRLGESLVLAMEYVDGLDLARLVENRGPLPVANACNYLHQAALGLQHAHEHGMVHRDIKPANLVLARAGRKPIVKVLDFGLAKVASEGNEDSGLTREGQMLGTPDFIAPEQIRDARSADIRADIYSLGCTFYCLLTGQPPYRGDSIWDLYQAHFSMAAAPLNLVRPEVPAELAALVAKMMAKEPELRFQEPKEVAQALVPFFKPAVAQSPSPTGESPRTDSQVEPTRPTVAGPPGHGAPILGRPPVPPSVRPSQTRADGVAWESLIDIQEDEPTVNALKSKPVRTKVAKSRPRPFEVPLRQPPLMRPAILAASFLVVLGLGVTILTVPWRGNRFEARKFDIRGAHDMDSLVEYEPIASESPGTKQRTFPSTETASAHADGSAYATLSSTPPMPVAAAESLLHHAQPGFVQLFNGKDLVGWKKHPSDQGNWRVENRTLIGSGPNVGNLFSDRDDYKDFHLRVEMRNTSGGNTGVFFRIPFGGNWTEGCEANIWDEKSYGTLHVYGNPAPKIGESQAAGGGWFTLEVIAEGNHLFTKVDGRIVTDFVDEVRPSATGHIALELPDPQTFVEFRNIEIKELSPPAENK